MLNTAFRPVRHSGFTLIELLIAVIILAILSSIAAPNFRDFIQRGQIRTSAEEIQNGLQLARGEAVRLNARVRFQVGSQTAQSSWTVSNDSTSAVIQQSRASSEGSTTVTATATPANATTVTFNSFGRVVANTDGTASLTQIDLAITGASSIAARRITVATGGGIRLCNPNANSSTDPAKC